MLSILTINISDGQSGVPVTHSFSVSFNKSLDEDSVSDATVYLYDTVLDEIVPCEIEVNGSLLTVYPSMVMRENRQYKFVLVGKGTTGLNDTYLEAEDGDYFETTEEFLFTTGTSSDVIVVEYPDEVSGMPGLVDGVAYESVPGGLEIDYVSPSYTGYGIPTSLNRIVIKFSDDVSEQNDCVDVTVRGLLGSDKYYTQYVSGDYVYRYEDKEGNYDWTIPSSDLQWAGEYLYINFYKNGLPVSASNPFFYNTSIYVELDSSLSSDSGDTLGVDTSYEFILEAVPFYTTLEEVKIDPLWLVVSNQVEDVLLYRLISYYSYKLRRKWDVDEDSFSESAASWVKCKVLHHLLYKLLVAMNVSGPVLRKSLGDFAISFGQPSLSVLGSDGSSALLRLERCIDRNSIALNGAIGKIAVRKIDSDSWKYMAVRIPRDTDFEEGVFVSNKGRFASEYSWTDWPFKAPPGYN